MKTKSYIIFLLFLAGTVLFTTSCKTGQKIQIRKNKEVKPIKLGKLYKSVLDSQLVYTEAQAKFSCNYKDEKENRNFSFSGTMRIKRDSIIWLTLSPAMGIEVVRIMLTPDSIAFLNRTNSTYYTGGYEHLNKIFQIELDFYTFQGIMMNELFGYPYTKRTNRYLKKFKASSKDGMYQFQSFSEKKINKKLKKSARKPKLELIVQNIDIEPETFKIHKVLIIDYITDRTLHIKYSDFMNLQNTNFPDKIKITFTQIEGKTDISIDYGKITITEGLRYPFKISSKYKRID